MRAHFPEQRLVIKLSFAHVHCKQPRALKTARMIKGTSHILLIGMHYSDKHFFEKKSSIVPIISSTLHDFYTLIFSLPFLTVLYGKF